MVQAKPIRVPGVLGTTTLKLQEGLANAQAALTQIAVNIIVSLIVVNVFMSQYFSR